MNIKEIKIKKLYGFLNKDVKFNSPISILVGINGSGKTSILNLINWILNLNFSELCLIEYDSITLLFTLNNEEYKIISKQNKVEVTINLENITKQLKYNQIQATFKHHPQMLTKNSLLRDSLAGVYDGLGPEEHEKETWKFIIYEIPKPIVIGLDRNLYSEEGDEVRIQSEILVSKQRISRRDKKNQLTPLDKVKSILSKEHNVYRNKTLQLYSSLNEKIMLSSFDKIFTDKNISDLLKEPKPSLAVVNILNEQVINFLKENQTISAIPQKQREIDSSIKKVNNYFDTLKGILKQSSNSKKLDLLYLINISQFKKINELIIEFSLFEETTKGLYNPLKQFLEVVNQFFQDSSKELYFDRDTSEIKFNILDKTGKKIDEGREVRNLSSGEIQVLVLLTYLKYNKNLNVFIIDEPELSLHPKWQEEFLPAVQKLMPQGAQLILATHSPEIIGNNKDFCTVLLPYNL